MKYLFFICWIILPAIGFGQVVHLKKKEIPATMKYTGDFRDAPCGADVDATFRKGSLAVTDLDQNGVDEVWLIYRVSCGGYQKPSPMKVIMHEGDKKFAMRGTTKLKLKETPVRYMGGEYSLDKNFTAGPAAFRDYANQLWMENRDEVAEY